MIEEKGATNFDKLCHKLFVSRNNSFARATGVSCGHCGQELTACYCESRLYAVSCYQCKTVALVMANNPIEAARKTFACSQGEGRECE